MNTATPSSSRRRFGSGLLVASLGLAAALAFAPVPLTADEGQWLPEQLSGLDWAKLEDRGLELSAEEIWNGESGLLSAAVNLNGCSASFVSDTGLVVTNHHCGFGAISRASSVEENHLRDGFVSRNVKEEIPSPGMSVSYVTGYDDVTSQMHAAADAAGDDPADRYAALQRERRVLARESSGEFSEAIVVPYFEGRIWRRIHRTVLRDVRLVYAPPRMVGEYGGETDNWMWPRHTGDFAFFRAYVSPDGKPAGYSEDNVPYNPPRHLQVSEEGANPGEFVMIMGYPGRTQRYLTSIAVAAREQTFYPARYELFTTVIADLEAKAALSEQAALELAPRIKSYANVEKNARGMIYGLARNKVVAKKEQEEAEFQAWVDGDASRRARYGSVLSDLMTLDSEEAERMPRDFVLDGLLRYSRTFSQARGQRGNDDGDGTDFYKAADPARDVLFKMADELPEEGRLVAYDKWLEGESNDLIALARALQDDYTAQREFRDRQAGLRQEVGALWIEAQEKWRGRNFYSDANSTLRVSMAAVKGYSPRDGVTHTPLTTVGGMLAKHTGEGDFDAPPEIFAAAEANPAALDIPVCFLSDGDTTGGNSGSPVVDGKGRLVGLNFDRVFENVAGDFGWNAARSRNISVDIRYVIWLMRDVWPAPRLLNEMNLEPGLGGPVEVKEAKPASGDAQEASANQTASLLRVRAGLRRSDDGFEDAEARQWKKNELRLGEAREFAIAGLGVFPTADGKHFGVSVELMNSDAFLQYTGSRTQRPLAILVGDEIVAAPMLQTAIPGRLNITGGNPGWSEQEANHLMMRMMSQTGRMPDGAGNARGGEFVNQGRPTMEFAMVLKQGEAGYEQAQKVSHEGKTYRIGPRQSFEVVSTFISLDGQGNEALGYSVLDKAKMKSWTDERKGREVAISVANNVAMVAVLHGSIPGAGVISGLSDAELDTMRSHFAQVWRN